MFSRRLLAPLGAAVLIAVTPALASAASWGVNGTGNARGTAGSLSAPSASPGTATSTTVPFTWTAASSGAQAQATYTVTSSPGAKICSALATTTGCTVGGLTAGTPYTFTIVATVGTSWTSGTASAGSVTTSTSAAVAITAANGNMGNTNLSFAGTGTNGGSVTVTVCKVATFPCTAPNLVGTVSTTSNVSGGTWTTGNVSGVVASTNYWAQAVESTPSATSSVVGSFQAKNGNYSF